MTTTELKEKNLTSVLREADTKMHLGYFFLKEIDHETLSEEVFEHSAVPLFWYFGKRHHCGQGGSIKKLGVKPLVPLSSFHYSPITGYSFRSFNINLFATSGRLHSLSPFHVTQFLFSSCKTLLSQFPVIISITKRAPCMST